MLPMVSIYLLKMPQISNNRNVMLIVYFRINWTFPIRQRIDYHVHGRSRWVVNYFGQIFAFIDLNWTTYNDKVWERKLKKYLIESLISANLVRKTRPKERQQMIKIIVDCSRPRPDPPVNFPIEGVLVNSLFPSRRVVLLTDSSLGGRPDSWQSTVC